jgi:hypothetical protein
MLPISTRRIPVTPSIGAVIVVYPSCVCALKTAALSAAMLACNWLTCDAWPVTCCAEAKPCFSRGV